MAEQHEQGTPKSSEDESVASKEANKGLQHSKGGTTTRDDATDLGVPMKPGDPSEPQGPEDALGEGPKRGDYSKRIGPDNYQPHETKPVEETDDDEDTEDKAKATVEPQRPRVKDIGDEPGKKGGVETS